MSDFRLPPTPIITGNPNAKQVPKPQVTGNSTASFREVLGRAVQQKQAEKQLTLSKHAMNRVGQRGIELSAHDIRRMEKAVDKAGDKGVTDTLVFMNNAAFIVNVPSKTVVTVVDGSDAQENVFTNINGAVIL
ncbi:MAG: flagellar protein [Oscillospiraceae bacterium]|nr:flagellar protein [Oscillospiraceae bacterium]